MVFLTQKLKITDDKTIKKRIKTKGMALFGNHSTCSLIMEHTTGIEPAYSAWEANVLPLNYVCSENIINYLKIKKHINLNVMCRIYNSYEL